MNSQYFKSIKYPIFYKQDSNNYTIISYLL